jgi:uncharacterized protein (DUF433 family)
MIGRAAEPLSHVDTSGPRPVVRGTDIKVSQIVSEHEHLRMTPDEIVEAHPHLTLADVHAALAYYFDGPEVVREEWREDAGALRPSAIATQAEWAPPEAAGRALRADAVGKLLDFGKYRYEEVEVAAKTRKPAPMSPRRASR